MTAAGTIDGQKVTEEYRVVMILSVPKQKLWCMHSGDISKRDEKDFSAVVPFPSLHETLGRKDTEGTQ